MATRTKKQRATKVIVFALLLTMTAWLMPVGLWEVKAAESKGAMRAGSSGDLVNFDIDRYIANLAFEEGNNPVNNGVPSNKDAVSRYHKIGHPSGVLMKQLNESSKFKNSLVLWDLLTADPSKFADQAGSKAEYNMVTLLSMLNMATTSNEMLDALKSDYVSAADLSCGWILSYLSSNYNIKTNRGVRISEIGEEKLNTAFQEMMRDKYNMTQGIAGGMKIFNYCVDGVSTIKDVVDKITSYIGIYQTTEETFNVLKEMKTFTSDLQLRLALDKIIACEDDVLASISECYMDSSNKVFGTVYKNVMGSVWGDIAMTSPFAPIYIAQKGSSAVCDVCFSTNAISEQYWKMDALCKAEEALAEASVALGARYIQDKTTQRAKDYNQSVNLYFNLYQVSADYAQEYADIIYKKSSAGIFANKTNYNNFSESIRVMRNSVAGAHHDLQMAYLNYLEGDYPEVYKALTTQKITANNYTKLYGSKQFNLKAEAIGRLSYKSNHPEIASVSSKGVVTVKSHGKATITITAAANGTYKKATKKITITVKPGKASINSIKANDGKITLKLRSQLGGVKYQYCYKLKTDSNYKSIYSKNSNITITKLKNNKTYNVKVRAYKKTATGTVYGSFSDVKSVLVRSQKALNEKAHQAYLQQLKKDKIEFHGGVDGYLEYVYKDFNGDGIDELLSAPGWGYCTEILYTYDNGKVKELHVQGQGGFDRYYKKNKVLRCVNGHMDSYYREYFQFEGKKLVKKAYRTELVDRQGNSTFEYYINDYSATKSEYQAYVNELIKGDTAQLCSKLNWKKFK